MLRAASIAAMILGMTAGLLSTAFAERPASAPGHVPEPQGLYQGALHGYTPDAIAGGTVVDTSALARLIADVHPVLLDVSEGDRKPPSMNKDTPWFPIHRSVPGAVFLQGSGNGTPDPAFAEAFLKRVSELAGGEKARPIVTFCHPDCWGSYNAAKRLIEAGYTRVAWFRGGTEAWQAEHDTRVVKPDPAWLAGMPKPPSQ